MTVVGLPPRAPLTLLPCPAVEYERESRTLPPHHLDWKECATDPRLALPEELPRWLHRHSSPHDLGSQFRLLGAWPTTFERSRPRDRQRDSIILWVSRLTRMVPKRLPRRQRRV